MNKQKGFIRIPLLIAIIVGVLVIGAGGFFGYKQYQIVKTKQIEEKHLAEETERARQEREKQAQELAEAQQKALEEAKVEIENLKTQAEESKQKQSIIEEKLSQDDSKSKDLTIQSSELAPYLTGIGEVWCNLDNGRVEGSGSTWNFSGLGYSVLTNNHVIKSENCLFAVDGLGVYRVDASTIYSWNNYTDVAVLKISAPTTGVSVSGLNYSISTLPNCETKMAIGSPVVIIGFPVFAKQTIEVEGYQAKQSSRTVTNGIISAQDDSIARPLGNLPYVNYYVSAKIDSGNSGGVVLSKTERGLCVLGIPTWLSLGVYETQGLVQNIHNVLYSE